MSIDPSVGDVSTANPLLINDTLNCRSLCGSKVFRVNLFNPRRRSDGSGVIAPTSVDLRFHLIHLRRAPGTSLRDPTSGGSSKFFNSICFSATPPGQYDKRSWVRIPKDPNLLTDSNSSLRFSGIARRSSAATLRSSRSHFLRLRALGVWKSCCARSIGFSCE